MASNLEREWRAGKDKLSPQLERYDAILTPPALGTAPRGLSSTGDPAFCSLWTLLGMPALTVPLMSGANGLPLGAQLVGRRDFDARLMRTARWLVEKLR
jgi:Asp-tRNA(Asn)/Glu-tRNA(Gln) amidotransferase A subunit family amidase